MKLTDVVDAYLTRSGHWACVSNSRGLLRRFCRVMGNPEIREVTPEAVAEFLHGKDRSARPGC